MKADAHLSVCVCVYGCFVVCISVPDVSRDQKRVSIPLELEVLVVTLCGCWELNPGPQEEQPVSLITAVLPAQLEMLVLISEGPLTVEMASAPVEACLIVSPPFTPLMPESSVASLPGALESINKQPFMFCIPHLLT